MVTEVRTDAQRAAVLNLPHIMNLKAELDVKAQAQIDRLTTEIMQEIYILGFEAGAASTPKE